MQVPYYVYLEPNCKNGLNCRKNDLKLGRGIYRPITAETLIFIVLTYRLTILTGGRRIITERVATIWGFGVTLVVTWICWRICASAVVPSRLRPLFANWWNAPSFVVTCAEIVRYIFFFHTHALLKPCGYLISVFTNKLSVRVWSFRIGANYQIQSWKKYRLSKS